MPYLSAEQGPALRDALKSLFSEPRLPDNPYFYLASLLAAYVDQSPLWKLVSLHPLEKHGQTNWQA